MRRLILFQFLLNRLPGVPDELIFLEYQRDLRDSGSLVLAEAMMVLDIIDVKAQALLAYISVSMAALIFLLTLLPQNTALHFVALTQADVVTILLASILALLVSILLCLSCLNIVGAHTITSLHRHNKRDVQSYEQLVVKVTLYRRLRYLVAHRISIGTALLTATVFGDLFIGSVHLW